MPQNFLHFFLLTTCEERVAEKINWGKWRGVQDGKQSWKSEDEEENNIKNFQPSSWGGWGCSSSTKVRRGSLGGWEKVHIKKVKWKCKKKNIFSGLREKFLVEKYFPSRIISLLFYASRESFGFALFHVTLNLNFALSCENVSKLVEYFLHGLIWTNFNQLFHSRMWRCKVIALLNYK